MVTTTTFEVAHYFDLGESITIRYWIANLVKTCIKAIHGTVCETRWGLESVGSRGTLATIPSM